MTTLVNTHSARGKRAQSALTSAHAPVHQSALPRLVLGLIALMPAVSFIAALQAEGAAQMGYAYFNVLWTGLLALTFSGWMFASGRFSKEQKFAWVFSWIVMPPLSLPLYWFRHVWNAPEATVTHD